MTANYVESTRCTINAMHNVSFVHILVVGLVLKHKDVRHIIGLIKVLQSSPHLHVHVNHLMCGITTLCSSPNDHCQSMSILVLPCLDLLVVN